MTHVIEVPTTTTVVETTDDQNVTVRVYQPTSGFPGYYGIFLDTTTQTNPAPADVRTVTYDTTVEAYGCSITNGTRITVANPGVYNLQFSLVATKTDGGTDTVDLWVAHNGTAIPDSNTRVTLSGNGARQVLAWNIIQRLAANDYLELNWYSADTDVSLPTQGPFTNPTRPRVPAVIATITQVTA